MDERTLEAIYHECFQEGVEAFHAGVRYGHGPYSAPNWHGDAWKAGWLSAARSAALAFNAGMGVALRPVPVPCPHAPGDGRLTRQWISGWVMGVMLDAHGFPEVH